MNTKTGAKNRILSVLLSLTMIISMLVAGVPAAGLTVNAAGGIWVGDGTQATPYLIEDAADLAKLAENVNGGASYEGEYFKLTADIDLSGFNAGEGWQPIGVSTNPFRGSFDGDGLAVKNLTLNRQDTNYIGLFGYIATGSTVKNLGIASGNIKGKNNVGGVVGYSKGTVVNCYNTGAVSGASYVGGVVGVNNGSAIENCYNTGAVDGTGYIGGVAGYNYNSGTVENSNNTGAVGGTSYVGGVVGCNYSDGTVENCYNTGAVNGAIHVGGLAGYSTGSIVNSYAEGCIIGTDTYIGGLVGYSSGSISNSHATGNVNGGTRVGGLVGQQYGGSINSCYNTGAVTGTGTNVGGVAGDSDGTVENCYNTGTVSGPSYAGGVSGYIGINGTVVNCYNTGAVSGTGYVGGVVGVNNNTVTSCYNTGAVSGTNCVGGVVGSNRSVSTVKSCYNTGAISGTGYVGGVVGNNNYGTVTNCNNTGAVSSTDYVGGVVGNNNGGTVTNSYYNIDAAQTVNGVAQTPKKGFGTGTDTTSGLTIEEMTAAAFLASINNSGEAFVKPDYSADKNGCATTFYPELAVFVESTDDFTKGMSKISAVAGGSCTLGANEEYFFHGDGEDEDTPYLIYTAKQLNHVRAHMNKNFKLMTNISLAGFVANDGDKTKGWEPVGSLTRKFMGVFDGANHKITGLWINRVDTNYIGLFGYADGSSIKNLGVETDDSKGGVAGKNYTGGLVGNQYSRTTNPDKSNTIINCYLKGSVTGNNYTGGLVGNQSAGSSGSTGGINIIDNCYATGSVTGSDYIGGLVGEQSAGSSSSSNGTNTIINCYATGSVTGSAYIGGLVGRRSAGSSSSSNGTNTIDNCYATGNATGSASNSYTGGLVGANSVSGTGTNNRNILTNSNSTGGVSGKNYTGGLIGMQQGGTITNCYVTGDVTGVKLTGGLAGWSSGSIAGCYATGNVIGTGDNVGGLAGQQNTSVITNCYATGNITGKGNNVGGLVGQQIIQDSTNNKVNSINYCYFTGNINDSGGSIIGILVGQQLISGAGTGKKNKVEYCYYNTDTIQYEGLTETGVQTDNSSEGNTNSISNNIALTTTQMVYSDVLTDYMSGLDTANWSKRTASDDYCYYPELTAFATDGDTAAQAASKESVTVARRTTVISSVPTAGAITYGQALSSSTLSGIVTDPVTGDAVDGAFVWTDGVVQPAVSDSRITEYGYTFTPTYPDLYKTAGGKMTITVNKKTLTVTAQDAEKFYGENNPAFVFTYDGFVNGEDETTDLTEDPQIRCNADNTTNVGTAVIEVSGGIANNYEFNYVNGVLTITAAGAERVTVDAVPDQIYTGSEIEPAITVKDGDTVLQAGTDYDVAYSNNINVCTANITVTLKGNYTGTLNGEFTINQKPAVQDVIDTINDLPDPVKNWDDADKVAEATNDYDSRTDDEKDQIPDDVKDKLKEAQDEAGKVNHTDGDVTITGDNLPWNVRVVLTPISESDPRWGAFFGKLTDKNLLALYDIKLIDTLTGKAYELPAGETVTVAIGGLTLTGAENTAIVHEKADGTVEYLTATADGNIVSFKTSSFSLFGVTADKDKESETPVVPGTGDSSNPFIPLAVMAVSMGGIVLTVNKRKRRSEKAK